MNSPSLETAIATGTIDLAILHPPLTHPDLAIYPLPDEQIVLAIPESHPLAVANEVEIRMLAGEPLLIAPRSIEPDIYDRMIALFQSQGVIPRIIQEVTPMTTLSGLVAAGAGLGFVTAGLSRQPRPGICYRPVTPSPPFLPIAAAWLKPDLPATAKLFLDEVVAHNVRP